MNIAASKRGWSLARLELLLIIGWLLLLSLVLIWNWLQIKSQTEKEALIALRMTVEKDLAFRSWASGYGGVYVPLNPGVEPNPYLSYMEDRDVFTTKGQALTLFNPACIMRQVYDIGIKSFGSYNRLVSANPVNPLNKADDWEREALQTFLADSKLMEISSVVDFEGQPSIRLVKPFYMEEACLTCHGDEGYKVGDLHGAVSASTPLANYRQLMRSRQLLLLPGYALIGLFGLGGIKRFMHYHKKADARLEYLSYHDMLTDVYNRNHFEMELKKARGEEAYPLSIISADLNGLKAVNDAQGHPAGDKLLVQAANVLKKSIGEQGRGFVARAGGDEFVVVLPQTNVEEARRLMVLIRENIARHNAGQPQAPLSLALGVATAVSADISLLNLYKIADDLMYEDKANG